MFILDASVCVKRFLTMSNGPFNERNKKIAVFMLHEKIVFTKMHCRAKNRLKMHIKGDSCVF
jgi:hypothetical protein